MCLVGHPVYQSEKKERLNNWIQLKIRSTFFVTTVKHKIPFVILTNKNKSNSCVF